MNRNESEGRAKNTKGNLKEAAGEALGDRDLKREGQADQAEGNVDKAAGKVQRGVDKLKDKLGG
jgi:uncharacterized protein YjbJ (UPF0337 family)